MKKDRMHNKLMEAFQPILLEIEDQSHLHDGHLESSKNQETHFSITMVSSYFDGLSLIARHRKVYETLADEMLHIHALNLNLKTP